MSVMRNTRLPFLIAVILVLGLFGFAVPSDECDGNPCEEAQTVCVDACCSLTADVQIGWNLIKPPDVISRIGVQAAGGGILFIPDIFRPPCA